MGATLLETMVSSGRSVCVSPRGSYGVFDVPLRISMPLERLLGLKGRCEAGDGEKQTTETGPQVIGPAPGDAEAPTAWRAGVVHL